MNPPEHAFLKTLGRILNAGQSRSVLLTGNIHDLFCGEREQEAEFMPLADFLAQKWSVPGKIILIYELNGPIRFLNSADTEKMRNAWLTWRTGYDEDQFAIQNMLANGRLGSQMDFLGKNFDEQISSAIGHPTVALELLRQLCLCSRALCNQRPVLAEDLIILIEAADMLIPESEIPRLSDADRHRVCICHDWFSDPGFTNGNDSVVLIAESASMVNHRVARLPQMIEVTIPAPDYAYRQFFIEAFLARQNEDESPRLWGTTEELARFTAGLSVHALRQLLKGAFHDKRPLGLDDVIRKVEQFIQSQVGEDVVEFKKPSHSLEDVVGFTRLKAFLREELIPRFRSSGADALPGAAVSGPIGGGKTFIFEAVANDLDIVVLVLKNIRSQWFGQTDVIFERLRRVLEAMSKVCIFVDEADTQFGAVGADAHPTERRLTGRIQAMMSDPRLRGRVIWLLMTARIHLLSPDIRRPGRVGDLIIPVLDPEGDDQSAFLHWAIDKSLAHAISPEEEAALQQAMSGYSAASFAALRSELKAKVIAKGEQLSPDEALAVIHDHIQPAIARTRRYQTLQALLNCTRRSLLPDPACTDAVRTSWAEEIRTLESTGIR